ncbi:DNA circularization protein [Sutterella sp.]|uniref:DNA circularization protein n=1 Tax=Sutterella sp. TaxID=1981025 RepID=UPI0026DF7207|nr:DNA circularization N-terminal domain-containing protein [Sutterella sp.]MDO5531427.1 DNA circularization N-terminal domain-containing protein [Sutterella sp.]
MSVLSDQLLDASFRGVPFYVETSDMRVGRRTQVHEYPQREKPYVEDLGRATRRLTFQAFVVGTDYIAQANALLAAIEKPGAGTLVHPQLGEMQATLTAVSVLHFDQALGRATVTLEAVEAGELVFLNSSDDSEAAALEIADELQQSAISAFIESVDLTAVSDYIDAAMEGDLAEVLGIVAASDLAQVFDFATEVAELASEGLAIITGGPSVFAQRLAGALGLSFWATTVTAWSRVGKQITNLLGKDELSSGTKKLAAAEAEGTTLSAVSRQTMTNRAALETVTRRLLIAQMAGVSALVGTSVDSTSPGAVVTFVDEETSSGEETVVAQSYDELIELREDLLDALNAEMLIETDDEVYQLLDEARVAIFEAITARADTASRLVTVTPTDVMPALVLAYDWHDDASRDREIAMRNGVKHEGFVPADPIRVSSE